MSKASINALIWTVLIIWGNFLYPCAAQAQLGLQPEVFATSFKKMRKELQVGASTIVVCIDLQPDRPYADVYRHAGSFPIESILRSRVKTRVSQEQLDAPVRMDLSTWRPVLFVVRPPVGTEPNTVAFHIGKPDADKVTDIHVENGLTWYYDQSPRPRDLTYRVEAGPRKFAITFLEPHEADFSTEFGVFYVIRTKSKPGFGLTKPVFALGTSKRLTLDLVTVFGVDSQRDATLGGALSYSTLLGSKRIEGYRGIFGFPVKITFTAGFDGLDLSRVNNAKGFFFGIGFAIPTSSR